MEIRNYKAAVEAFRKAVELNPNNREAMRSLGIALELNGETNEAISQFDRYLERFPDDPEIAFKQADYLGWSRYAYRHEDAIRYYRMGLNLKEDFHRRHQLARLLGRDRNTLDDALQEYRKLLSSQPDNAAVRAEYRKLLLWDRRFLAEAIREYSEQVARHPEDGQAALQLARLLAQDESRTSEAIEAYRKLVEKKPEDKKLRKEFASALAKDHSRLTEAKDQYQIVLQGEADLDTRVAYADLLAADEPTREQALERYQALVNEAPKRKDIRLKYARLLMENKESSREAISEYGQVLGQDPRNTEAHAGLAKAYAWNGDSDRALYHSRLARGPSTTKSEVATLEKQLTTGREPRVTTAFDFFYQPSGAFNLGGVSTGVRGKLDVSPFITGELDAELEQYWNSSNYAIGGYFSFLSQMRFAPTDRAELGVGYRTVRSGLAGLSLHLQYERVGESFTLRPRFERGPKYDSFLSLVGVQSPTGALIGQATANLFAFDFEETLGGFKFLVNPQAGWISDSASSANAQLGVDASVEVSILRSAAWSFSLGYRALVSHYGSDHSGFVESPTGPLPGGYFSPAFYLNQGPRVRLQHVLAQSHDFELSGGPALQYQKLHPGEGALLWGGDVRASYLFQIGEHLQWKTGVGFLQVSNLYGRLNLDTFFSYVF